MEAAAPAANVVGFTTMAYDFTTLPDRRDTGSLKWEKYRGRDVLPFWVADMDFVTAPEILGALRARLDHGVLGYTVPPRDAVEAVLGHLERAYRWKVEAEWITWFPGVVPALHLLVKALSEPGEAVVTTTPVYPPFLSAPGAGGRSLVTAPHHAGADGRWRVDWPALEAAIPAHARLFYLCHPQNPTGRIYDSGELLQHVELCRRHGLTLVSDEIHADLGLDLARPHLPTATVDPEFGLKTITLLSPSKTWNLAGLACAYAIIPDPAQRAKVQRAIRGIITEINLFGYAGLTAAYTLGEPWRRELVQVLAGNRDHLMARLAAEAPGLVMRPMEATYLAWIDTRSLQGRFPDYDPRQASAFFERRGLGLSDGAPFGAEGFVRLNFGCPRAWLDQGIDRLVAAVR